MTQAPVAGADASRRRRLLAAAGFLATAVTFGPARTAYGLFLPQFRAEFGLGTGLLAGIAAAAYAARLLALVLAARLVGIWGPKVPVVLGGALAGVGLGAVAAAPGVWVLAAGVVIAACSAGLTWSPYNDAAKQIVEEPRQAPVLAAISTGTTVGIALSGVAAGAAALYGLPWRWVWASFALSAVVLIALNAPALPSRPVRPPEARGPRPAYASARYWRLYGTAAALGVGSAVWYGFAVDRAVTAGALPMLPGGVTGPAMFILVGLFGTAGMGAGHLATRLGLTGAMRLPMAVQVAALTLIAAVPAAPFAALASAALFGAGGMTSAAVLANWALRAFPHRPGPGFTVVIGALSGGTIAGAALVAATSSLNDAVPFWIAAALLAVAAAFGACRAGDEG